jgi:hypothetical protein
MSQAAVVLAVFFALGMMGLGLTVFVRGAREHRSAGHPLDGARRQG